MSGHRSVLRRAALMFAAHARRALMKRNAFWADGMEQEAHHIADDGSALRWALGCVLASYIEIARAQGFLLAGTIRVFLAALTFYFSCENFLGPLQALLCHMQLAKPASQLLAFFPIEQTMCVSWPAVPMPIQMISLVAGALYLIAALELLRVGPAAIRWFIPAFAASVIAFVVEKDFAAVDFSRYVLLFEQAQLRIIAGRTIFPVVVAIALWLATGKDEVKSPTAAP